LVPFQYNRYETLQRGHNAGELLDPPQGQFDGGVNALPLERIAALDQSPWRHQREPRSAVLQRTINQLATKTADVKRRLLILAVL
jgi:hypothetical protein